MIEKTGLGIVLSSILISIILDLFFKVPEGASIGVVCFGFFIGCLIYFSVE